MSDPTFTILLPVHRPPAMLPFAINSVLAQERRDFELFVICDGAPPETVSCAQEFAAGTRASASSPTPRVQASAMSIATRRYSRRAVPMSARSATTTVVPQSLDEIAQLLRDVDFGNLSYFEVMPDDRVILIFGDASDPAIRNRMMHENFNFMGPTVWGYRLSAYRSLPVGTVASAAGLSQRSSCKFASS